MRQRKPFPKTVIIAKASVENEDLWVPQRKHMVEFAGNRQVAVYQLVRYGRIKVNIDVEPDKNDPKGKKARAIRVRREED